MSSVIQFFFIISLSSFISWAQEGQERSIKGDEATIYSMSFERLENFGSFRSSELKGKKSLWVLYEPECPSCEKQFKDLSCLPKEVEVLGVGFWGSKDNLTKTLRKAHFKGTGVLGGPDLEKALSLKQTPTLLLVDANGKIKQKMSSFYECRNLKKLFSEM